MELKDANGNYILPDNFIFEPIYKDIASRNKTLIAHVADPSSLWQPPNPESPDYRYYQENPQWYMYTKPHRASRERILQARDKLVELNPKLVWSERISGAWKPRLIYWASISTDIPIVPVDLAGRMPYIMSQPRADMIAFITKYEDRLIYGTDIESGFGEKEPNASWEDTYAKHWRFLATNDMLSYRGHKIQGLALSKSTLRKLHHNNAVHWFPGILHNS